ncbi:MAG: ABC transporter permease subunit [Oscillospiraceae bacterium]|nr:ABC transporter permease subunit [Oscillospiraceae bacterium]
MRIQNRKIKPVFTILNIPNLLFVLLLYMSTWPSVVKTKPPYAYLAVLVLIEIYFVVGYLVKKKVACHDISCILFAFFTIWAYITKTGKAHSLLVMPMENVFYVFTTHYEEMFRGLMSSLYLVFWGMVSATVLAVILGVLIGWVTRLNQAILPIVRIISPIPSLAYTTYVVAAMPNFKISEIVIIFLGIFWPTFSRVISTVATIDKKIIDSARVLNVGTFTMLKDIVYPYVKPTVLRNLTSSLSTAFLCLTGAELIGASSGLGYFIRKYSEYANYTNVLAGIIFMGVVVTVLSFLVRFIQNKFIKW